MVMKAIYLILSVVGNFQMGKRNIFPRIFFRELRGNSVLKALSKENRVVLNTVFGIGIFLAATTYIYVHMIKFYKKIEYKFVNTIKKVIKIQP